MSTKWFILAIMVMSVGCDKRIDEGYITEKKIENDNLEQAEKEWFS